ncbi:hypothetical protein JHK85_018357 [Glycine max]|nr:hypothetical protein JHK85_018357 [Glycine max]
MRECPSLCPISFSCCFEVTWGHNISQKKGELVADIVAHGFYGVYLPEPFLCIIFCKLVNYVA